MSHTDAGKNKVITPWYQYKIDRIRPLGGLELGITAGCRFNKERTYIETGVRTENAECGFHLDYLAHDVNSLNSNNTLAYSSRFGSASGTVGKKIPFLFSTQLKEWEVHLYKPTAYSIHCNIIAGINYFYQPTGLAQFNFGGITSMVSPTILMHAEPSTYALRSWAILYEAGLSFDLRKRQREWFTLTLYYMQGFSNLSVEMVDITLTDITTNNVEKYHYNSYGRGSALMLEISKKIFFTKANKPEGVEK